MSAVAPQTPVLYQPQFETPEPDEAQTTQETADTIGKIHKITFKDSGDSIRGVHAKSHGLLVARLEVPDNLPAQLAQGIFAQPGSYQAVMRFSTSPGDMLPDSVSTPRGLAVKILGVSGDRLPGSENDTTQDFLMVNGPAFSASTAKAFLKNLKLLAGTTDKAPNAKKVLSAALRGLETVVEAVGGESATLKSLGGHPETEILGETFFSQAPLLYGPYMAKVSLVPISPELTALTDKEVQERDSPNYLRESVNRFFQTATGIWELRVQLCTDLEAMPIEDASKVWPEDKSPYVTVARLIAEPQSGWDEQRSRRFDAGMSFSPWHGVAAHRPSGFDHAGTPRGVCDGRPPAIDG